MPVSSAKELSELIRTLSTQFSNTHSPGAHGLWTQVDAHINHVMQEGGRWIDAEISTIERDWQGHRRAVQDAQHWFEHHVSLLQKVADDALRLSTEAISGGASAAFGAIRGLGSSIGNALYVYGGVGAVGGYLMTTTDFFHMQKYLGGSKGVWTKFDKFGKVTGGIGMVDSFGRAIQNYQHGHNDQANREVIDGVIAGAGMLVPEVGMAKMAFDGGWEIGKMIDGGDQHRISGPSSDSIWSYAQAHGHSNEAHRYDGPVGFLRFGKDGVGAAKDEAGRLLSKIF
jgi:hypothetical protein